MSLAYWKAYSHLVQTAHVQLSMLNIGKTWKRATIPFHVVQQGAILVRIAQCHEHTLGPCQHRGNPFGSHNSNMQSSGTMILLGPSRWTVILCWDHQH